MQTSLEPVDDTGTLHMRDLLWCDSKKINLVYAGDGIRKLMRTKHQVAGGDWDTTHRLTFNELDVYQAFEARFTKGAAWKDTDFYQRVLSQIDAGEAKWSCQNQDDFNLRLEGLDRLYEDVKRNGYKTQHELGSSDLNDEIRICIRRDGRLLFLDGRHRLSIARLLSIPRVPVRVVRRHEEWEAFKKQIREYASSRKGRVYQTIDHPDLIDIPAHHGFGRADMIASALVGFPTKETKLLDIGTHWGGMAQQMRKLGFQVTGVESNKRCANIARTLSIATESGFDVWHGSIFDLPEPGQYQVVLALNIFHHFIKTPELHEALTRLLGRLKPKVMIFEPHRHDPPSQMLGAYRNYTPQQFTEFVAAHTGLRNIEYLGDAADGRPLYKLSRRPFWLPIWSMVRQRLGRRTG